MIGREARKQRLAPSFLVVAAAIGCGGASKSDGPELSMNPPPSGGGSGGSAGSAGSTVTGTGGAPVLAGSGGGGVGSGGGRPGTGGAIAGTGGANTCPEQIEPFAACVPTAAPCSYNPWNCFPAGIATCLDGRWVVSSNCNPPAPSCPQVAPESGTSCSPAVDCAFPLPGCESRRALCESGTWSYSACPEGGAGGDGGEGVAGQGGASE